MKVAVFFFRPTLGGGTTTYTAHLMVALRAAECEPCLYRVRQHNSKNKPFGNYQDVTYTNIEPIDAMKIVQHTASIMACPANVKFLPEPDIIKRMVKAGMRVVVHDPTELSVISGERNRPAKLLQPPILIRQAMKRYYPDGIWIPHPYRRAKVSTNKRIWHAISIARVAADKRPILILKANRLLPKSKRVRMRGAEFRLYSKGLQDRYGDVYQQSGSTLRWSPSFEAPVQECAKANYNVDMSWFENDGGGTQYAQLEAMDAGTVNIMHRDWFRFPGELKANKHVLAVEDEKHLAKVLDTKHDNYNAVQSAGYSLLAKHAPARVGKMYREVLSK